MPFLTLSVFCLPAVTVIANKRPPEQVCIKRTSIAALGWLAWTAFFLFLFPFFASYCPSFSPFFLTFHPHGPAAELTPIACGPDCPLLFLLSYSSQNPQAFLYSYFTRILFTIANSFPSVFTLIKEDSAALCPFLIYIALSTHFHFNIFFQIFILLINPLLKLLGAMRTKLLKDGSLTRLLFYNYLKSSPYRISQVPVFHIFITHNTSFF